MKKLANSEGRDKMQMLQKIRNRIWAFIVLAMLMAVGIFANKTSYTADTYNEAVELIACGRYEEAGALLEEIENYKDTESLRLLCEAHEEYEAGNITKAYSKMNLAKFRYEQETLGTEICAFKTTLNEEYDAYIAEQEAYRKQQYENRIKNGVPYVGMPERRINDTSLGSASDKVRHNRERKNGQQYIANLYDFYKDGKVIFTARCVEGFVTEVWDKRDTQETSATTHTKSGSSKSYSSDPSADGFRNPEDFYDYYWDDFFDYEDAEDYYYEHGGK